MNCYDPSTNVRCPWQPRGFDARPACDEAEARRVLAGELGCDEDELVEWRHPDRDTRCLSLPDADGDEPWMEQTGE